MSLLDDLRAEGLTVRTGDNWETHQAPGQFHPVGVLNHWDAVIGWPGVDLYRRSPRPELNHQPTYHVVIQRDGTVWLISQRHVYGAGSGDPAVLDAIRDDKPTPKPTVAKGVNGNPWLWAVCVNYWPDGSPLPVAQYESLVRVNAALCRRSGWDPQTRVSDHDGWTTRKDDLSGRPPEGWTLQRFRNDVQTRLIGDDMPKVPQPEWMGDEVIARLRAAKVLTTTPTEESEDMWRVMAFLDRAHTSLSRAIKAVKVGGGVTAAAVIAEIVNRLT